MENRKVFASWKDAIGETPAEKRNGMKIFAVSSYTLNERVPSAYRIEAYAATEGGARAYAEWLAREWLAEDSAKEDKDKRYLEMGVFSLNYDAALLADADEYFSDRFLKRYCPLDDTFIMPVSPYSLFGA